MALTVIADDQPYLISPAADIAVMLALIGGLVMTAYQAARRGARTAWVAGMGFASAFVLASYSAVAVPPFRRLDLALLVLPASLLFAALIAWAARNEGGPVWVAGALTIALGAGLMVLYTTGVTGSWSAKGSFFATRVTQVAAVGLIGPPAIAWLLARLQPAEAVSA
jgi:hypothetical protein